MSIYSDIQRIFEFLAQTDRSNLPPYLNELINSFNQQKIFNSQESLKNESSEINNFSIQNLYNHSSNQANTNYEVESQISSLNLIKQIIEILKSQKPNLGPYLEITLSGPANFSGGFSDIYICNYQSTLVAVKLSKPDRLSHDQSLTTRELKRQNKLNFPFIAECLGHTLIKTSETSQVQLGIVTKYYSSGSLSDLIKKNVLTYPEKLSICINLSKAIEFIHIHRLCHFDVKPANVLIDDQRNPRLSDLGTCQKEKINYKNSLAYTLGYAPPEQMRGKAVKESDVWSFGMTVYAVFAGRSPFKEIKEDKEKFCKQGMIQLLESFFLPDFDGVDEQLVEVVKMCCKVDPKERARLKTVREKLDKILKDYRQGLGNDIVPEVKEVQDVVMEDA